MIYDAQGKPVGMEAELAKIIKETHDALDTLGVPTVGTPAQRVAFLGAAFLAHCKKAEDALKQALEPKS